MRGTLSWKPGAILLGLVLTLLPSSAWAYIDPGQGALVLQALLSGFFGAVFLARRALQRGLGRLLAAFGWGQGTTTSTSPPDV